MNPFKGFSLFNTALPGHAPNHAAVRHRKIPGKNETGISERQGIRLKTEG
jgi:hypothetical protein